MSTTDGVAGSIRPETSGNPSSAPARSPKLAGLIASRVYAARPAVSDQRRPIVDSIDLSSAPAARPTARADAGNIPFYSNPARNNEVATQIALGRSLDLEA